MKKILFTGLSLFLSFGISLSPVLAQTSGTCALPDADNDKYFASPNHITETSCDGNFGVKGYEPEICDCPELKEGRNCTTLGGPLTAAQLGTLYDINKYTTLMKGRNFNPGMPDTPDDYIDQNCDGFDETVITDTGLLDYIEKAIAILGSIVAGVSTLILIWGGIMYATAAGEEEKLRKARKAMIGAIIGLIVGLMAALIVGQVVAWIR